MDKHKGQPAADRRCRPAARSDRPPRDLQGQPVGHSLSLALVLSLTLHGSTLAALVWWPAPQPAVTEPVIAVEWVSGFATAGKQKTAGVPTSSAKESSRTAGAKSPGTPQLQSRTPAPLQTAALKNDSLPPAASTDTAPEAPHQLHPISVAPTTIASLPPLPRRKPRRPQVAEANEPRKDVSNAPVRSSQQQLAHTSGGQTRETGSGDTKSGAAAGTTNARFEGPGLANPAPRYPRAARLRGLEGKLVVRAEVSPQGQARAVWVERSSGHDILDAAALDAIKGWRFIPATLAGLPVESLVDVPLNYYLQ